jgi:hypothetical protein
MNASISGQNSVTAAAESHNEILPAEMQLPNESGVLIELLIVSLVGITTVEFFLYQILFFLPIIGKNKVELKNITPRIFSSMSNYKQ